MRSLRYEFGVVGLAVALGAAACHPAVEAPGVPLYPNSTTNRLPRNQVALVDGPIEKIDGRNVLEQGTAFELLPGCHVVELDRRPPADAAALTSGTYFSGQFPVTVYAIPMKPGGRYSIQRLLRTDGGGQGQIILSGRGEETGGAVTDLSPVKSEDEIRACKP